MIFTALHFKYFYECFFYKLFKLSFNKPGVIKRHIVYIFCKISNNLLNL